ncbi:unnamed protein product [Effrenium voratum]|nr:unnamed protein product [Effrenium voratum]
MEVAAYNLSEVVVALQQTRCQTLHACETRIGDLGAERVAMALAANTSTQTLRLNDNDIGDAGVGLLAEALRENRCLATLSLNRNRIGALGAAQLSQTLASSALTQLDLSQNGLGDEGVVHLAEGLSNPRGLLVLELQVNRVGDAGAQALAAVLPQTRLRQLHLRDNQISGPGAMALAEALPRSKLELLDLCFNRLGAGAAALVSAAEASERLTAMQLTEPSARLQKALGRNKRLVVVTLRAMRQPEGQLRVSCTYMSGGSVLEAVRPPEMPLLEMYLEVAEVLGQPVANLRLVDTSGQELPRDSPLRLERLLEDAPTMPGVADEKGAA